MIRRLRAKRSSGIYGDHWIIELPLYSLRQLEPVIERPVIYACEYQDMVHLYGAQF